MSGYFRRVFNRTFRFGNGFSMGSTAWRSVIFSATAISATTLPDQLKNELKQEEFEEEPLRYAWVNKANQDFDPILHHYPKVLNAELHPLVSYFLSLSVERIAHRYCHLHPRIDQEALVKLLHREPSYLRWSGADLFVTTNKNGVKKLTVIETNSCPSGQKSMPRPDQQLDEGYGYKKLIEQTFKPMLENVDPSLYDAKLAVIFDKNEMEVSGYAQAMSAVFGEDVYVAQYFMDDPNPPVRFDENGVMSIRLEDDKWVPVRAAFRYVTQNPWDRIPIASKTLILNPIIACLAGGRNKNLAAKAYEIFNANLQSQRGLSGLKLNTPETVKDVPFEAIPLMIERFGGKGVIKSPYGNAGVDVFTITSQEELETFMAGFGKEENDNLGRGYGEKFIVQSLIGNANWSSNTFTGVHYHVGTVPDKNGKFYAADIRMMIHYDGNRGWKPLCIYSRRAKEALSKDLDKTQSSWDILGTNLSVKVGKNEWQTDTNRLLLMDTRAFNRLGLGLDEMINAYVQTVLATISIDDLCKVFMENEDDETHRFDYNLFSILNEDNDILNDIKKANNFK